MNRLLPALSAALFLLACPSFIGAGAKDGKQRWTFNLYKTGAAKWNPPIKVPGEEDGKPGKVELTIVFKAKEVAEFVVIGDGDTAISLFIYDAREKLIAKDADPAKRGSDLCVCEWTPQEEGEFRIVIMNHGKVFNMVQAGCN